MLVVILISSSSAALTARQLREKCLAEQRVMVAIDTNNSQYVKATDYQDGGYCFGYIDGATDALNGFAFSDGRMLRIATGQSTFGDLVQIFLQWTEQNPAGLDNLADGEIFAALVANKKADLYSPMVVTSH